MVSSTATVWIGPFVLEGVSDELLTLLRFIETPVFNANSVDPNQTPRLVTSDMGLHCLPMSFFGGC